MAYSSFHTIKQQVLNDFNSRSQYENDFHRRAADRLVELAKIQSGQNILDVATGTGLAAIAAAQLVGSTGSVLGTDFAVNMLQQARQRAKDLELKNIIFEEVDADEQELPEQQFDVILCSSAIVYLTDIPTTLNNWFNALKPKGSIAFTCLSATSPSASFLFRALMEKYGVTIPNPNELLGTPERCYQILTKIGFNEIKITTEQFGFYLQDVKMLWSGNANSTLGLQDAKLSAEQLDCCRQEFFSEIKKASIDQGYWNDVTMFFVTAQKSRELVAS
jgi:ubiquinone/menaquinone biosynthesis C-methylase UbiE